MVQEKGNLRITKTPKGAWDVVFERENGKPFPVSFWKPKDDLLNGKEAILTSEKGAVLKLELAEGGQVLYQKPGYTQGQAGNPHQQGGAGAPQLERTLIMNDTYELAKAKLPDRTKQAMTLAGTQQHDIDNFHLKFYKAACLEEVGNGTSKEKFVAFASAKKKTEESQSIKVIQANFGHTDFKAISDRSLHTMKSLGFNSQQGTLVSVEAESTWRWVVGLGNASVYENGMTLHHVYGIPYIPGSGVKGMLRTWIIVTAFDRDETSALKNPVFQTIFGAPSLDGDEDKGIKGQATFFDAFPLEPVKIEPDIMNNHFQDYYEGNTPPADWINPNPIFFMTVTNTKIRFRIGVKGGGEPVGEAAGKMLNGLQPSTSLSHLVKAWLKEALEQHGIGAKTAVGYGRMKTCG